MRKILHGFKFFKQKILAWKVVKKQKYFKTSDQWLIREEEKLKEDLEIITMGPTLKQVFQRRRSFVFKLE